MPSEAQRVSQSAQSGSLRACCSTEAPHSSAQSLFRIAVMYATLQLHFSSLTFSSRQS